MSQNQQSLAAKLQQLSPEKRQALLEKLQQQKAQKPAAASQQGIKPIARTEASYKASKAQQRLWFLQQLQPESSAYHIAASFIIEGPLQTDVLQQSLNILVARHESLRTVFFNSTEGLKQKVLDASHLPLQQLPLQNTGQQTLENFTEQPFNLAEGPLVRTALIEDGQQHIFSVVLHHIITDAWSCNLLLQELSLCYNALCQQQKPLLNNSPIQYIDYCHWQQQQLEKNSASEQQFWQQTLKGYENINLPTDALSEPKSQGSFHRVELSASQKQQLQQHCQNQGATLFHGLLALYQILLQRYCQQQDFCIGIPVAGRNHIDTESILGLFVNSLPIRNSAKANIGFNELLHEVKTQSLNALSHQLLPFEKIAELAGHDNSHDINPVYQTFFSYDQGATSAKLQLNNCKASYLPTDIQASKFPLSLTLKDLEDGSLSCHFEYASELFLPETIKQIAQHFLRLANLALQETNTIGQWPLLTDAEKHTQLVSYNQTQQNFPAFNNVLELIIAQATKTPTAIAVSDTKQLLSYQDLLGKSYHLAKQLAALNPEQNVIAVQLERSVNISVALLACHLAGCPYLPILPATAPERLRYILKESQSQVVISQSHLANNSAFSEVNVLAIDELKLDARHRPFNQAAGGDALFNIIYTSGSTGTPKGVMVTQKGILNRLQWMQARFNLQSEHVVLQKTPINFDVSVWELFLPLMAGARLHFLADDAHKSPADLQQCIEQQGITHCHFVPSMLDSFLQQLGANACPSLQQVFCSGEALQATHVKQFYQLFNHCQLHNLYGPTEAAIDVSHYACHANSAQTQIPIGKPIANTQLFILDKNLQLLPHGAQGELCIAGIQLAQGYWQQQALSDASFVDNPFYPEHSTSAKLYRTGDLARFAADGNILYLGRTDQQIKIRGQRIELGEIENCLLQHSAIQQAVAYPQQLNGQQHLVAYYSGQSELESKELKAHLLQFLPDYMLPTAFIYLPELPLSNNGKIDRKQLPQLTDIEKPAFVAPETATEKALADIWQTLLTIDSVSIRDNFFHLGGHSILASQMLMHIKQQFQVDLPLRTLFEINTIEGLAKMIQALNMPSDSDKAADDDDEFEEGIL